MRKEFLNISVLDDDELENILNGKILSRKKLHHWPLSYVEKVTLSDGRQLVYKSQIYGQENVFYSSVEADFLLKPLCLGMRGGSYYIVLPYCMLPHKKMPESSAGIAEMAHGISNTIQCISNAAPVMFDWSTHSRFAACCDKTADIISPAANTALLERFLTWAHTSAARLFTDDIGLVHADIKPENLYADDEGNIKYIIDWQLTCRAPRALDAANAVLLANLPDTDSFDPQHLKLAGAFHAMWYSWAYARELSGLPHVLSSALAALQRCF